jgi:hypothetical protein
MSTQLPSNLFETVERLVVFTRPTPTKLKLVATKVDQKITQLLN